MFKKLRLFLMVTLLSQAAFLPKAFASDPFLGEITWFAGDFAPRGWAFCDGQLLPISQYSALFSILGTQYGGDGRTTFALPDMRGRMPMHSGDGPGLTSRQNGQMGGEERVTLTTAQMPNHTHVANGSSAAGSLNTVDGNAPAGIRRGYDNAANVAMDNTVISNSGGGQSHENMPPFNNLRCIIALVGTFPSRN